MDRPSIKPGSFLSKVCMFSYIRIGILLLLILSYLFEITRRDFWWNILGSFSWDLFQVLFLVQLAALLGTYLISKRKWVGFAVYTLSHILHFSLLIAGVYNLVPVTAILSFVVMVTFISLFIIGLKKA